SEHSGAEGIDLAVHIGLGTPTHDFLLITSRPRLGVFTLGTKLFLKTQLVFTKQFQTRSSSRFGRRRWIPTAIRNSGGKPTWFDGYLYPSITEAHCAMLIKDKQRRGEYTWVRRQVLLPMIV